MVSDDHEIMTSVLDWFMEIEEWLPGAHSMVGDIIYGPIPLSDANNLYDLADQWGRLADALNDAYQDVYRAADPILDNWSGDGAATQFAEQWFAYLEGLRQTAESAAQMQRGVQNLGLEVELMKFMALLNLIMLAVSIYMLIAAAIPTGGGSLGAAPGLFMGTRLAINAAAAKTVGKIASIAMRVVMRNLSKVFGRLPALATRAMPAGARTALPALTTAVATRVAPVLTSVTTRYAVARGARTVAVTTTGVVMRGARSVAARGISRAVANRMAAQAMRGVARREVYGTLASRSTAGVQRALAREIRQQLLHKWTGRAIREGADEVITRIAQQQVARSLGREFAGYVGVRVAFGAGFMGGGNLLGQFGQIVSGNRTEGVDWGQVGVGTLQGAAFGAGMFGGPLGHAIGGGLAGGGFTLGTELYQQIKDGQGIDLEAVDWTAVGHHAAQGAAMGVIFGGQTHLENANIGGLGMRVGRDVHVLPGADGGFNVASSRTVRGGSENLLLTSDGYVAFEGPKTPGSMPDAVLARPDAVQAMDQHWQGRDSSPPVVEAPAAPPGGPRVEAPGVRPDTSAPARAGGDGGGGGGGPRQNTQGGGGTQGAPPPRGEAAGPSTIERVRVPTGDGPVPRDPGPPAAGRPGVDGPVPHDPGPPAAGRPGVDGPVPHDPEATRVDPEATRVDPEATRVDPEVARSGGEPSRSGPDAGPPVADRSGEASSTRTGGDGPPARTEPGRSGDGPVPSDRPGGDRLAGGDRGGDGDRSPVGARDRDGADLAPPGRGEAPSGARVDVDGGAARTDVPPRDGEVAGRRDDGGSARPERPTRDGDPAAARNNDGPPPRDPAAARPDDGAAARAGDEVAARADDGAAARAGDEVAARADDGAAARAGDGAAARPDDGAAARGGDGAAARPNDGAASRGGDGAAARPDDGAAARDGDGAAARADDSVPVRPDEGRVASAGHETGVDPSPRSIEQGTVRFREHPEFARYEQELREYGVVIRDRPEARFPEVIYTHVWNEKGTTLLRIEKEMVVLPDMRFIDFEHEMGHVHQFESRNRFREGPPSTAPPRREMPNGRITGINGKSSIENRVPVVEYHVRLEEVKRLIERGVDRRIIDEHLRGLDERADVYRAATKGQYNKNAKWAAQHFGDIPRLQREVAELRAALEAGPPPARPDAPPPARPDAPQTRADGPEPFAKRSAAEPLRPADPAPPADGPPRDGDSAATPRDPDGGPADRGGDTPAARRDGADPTPVTRDPDASPPPRDPDSALPRDSDSVLPRDPESVPPRDSDSPLPRDSEASAQRDPDAPPPEDGRMESAGHDRGEDPSPRSIEQGTVRYDEHPDFPRLQQEMLDLGVTFHDLPHDEPPHVIYRHVFDADGNVLLRVEKEMHLAEGMRFIDFEHEVGHVRQMEDPRRFPDGPPSTAKPVLENAEGVTRTAKNKPFLGSKGEIVEYHVRLQEVIRLIERGVDAPIVQQHLRGVDQWAGFHDKKVRHPESTPARWAREHFSDIPELRARVKELRVPFDYVPPRSDGGAPPPSRPGDGGMAKDGVPPRNPDADYNTAAGRDVRGVEPSRLVDVPGRVPEHPVAASHEVAAVLNAELGALVDGRTADAPDRPHRAEWDAEAQTMRVRFGDGLEVDVRLQVNESVPPGRSIVVRPELEVMDGTWRQNGAAGIVLSSHVPADPVARAAHVQQALDSAFRTLHGEVTERLQLPPRDPGEATPPQTARHFDTSGGNEPHGSGRDPELANSGGTIRPRDEVQAYEWSDVAYDRFRSDDGDVVDIARNLTDTPRLDGGTGFTAAEIGEIKRHVMVEPHLLSDYEGGVVLKRFDSDPAMAEAWIRLRAGQPLPEDILLLHHEQTEARYLADHRGTTYLEAHQYANQRYDWSSVKPARTGEDLASGWTTRSSDGEVPTLPDDPRGRASGGVHLRFSGDEPPFGDRQDLSGGDTGGRDGGPGLRGRTGEDSSVPPRGDAVPGEWGVRGVEPSRLVDVPGRVPEHPVAASHEVAAVLNAELGALVDGRTADAPDRPHRAEWDAEAQTMRVRFGDGLEVDVRLQVNESVPPGRSIVVRPELEVMDGTWRQNGAAGIVLSSHVPADPVARAAHVQQALDSAFRTLHGEVTERLQLPSRDPGVDGPAPRTPQDPAPSDEPHQMPRDPDQEAPETADTGGAIRPRDFGRQFDWAEAAYDRFRADSGDVADIAANLADAPRADGRTGFTPAEIREIKSHLMENAQPRTRSDGKPFSARFDADPDIAEAWIRLREGRHLAEDLLLLEHELAERALMRANPEWDYSTAHREANRLHNWEQNQPGRTGERYDTSWGNEPHGNSDRLSQDPGRRDSGGASVRLSGSDGPHAGHRQGEPGGAAGGRDGGQDVRGRALEDPSARAAREELAGPGIVRGVEPSLRALEDAVRPDVPARDVDKVGRHDATPVDAPAPAALTPDSVRQTMTGRNVPEQLPRWAEEHLTARSESGTPRPKAPEEIEATVRDLAEQAVDLVTPRTEAVDGVRHTASQIEGTGFVPEGRPWNHPDVTVHELQQAATGVLARDFADGTVAYVARDAPYVRVELTDGTAQHFAPYVDRGMSSLAETTVRAGTPEDPHLVRVNNRVAADQLSRVWVHEITETLALRHAEQTRPQPHGVLRRAMAAIGRIFGGGDAAQPAPRVEPHAAARMNERVYLQRLHDWAHARPDEQARLSREIAGVERDLATLGHPVEPLRSLFEPPRAPVPDGVLRGHDPSARWPEPDPARQGPEAFRYDPEPPRQEPEPLGHEPTPESTHDAHWADRPWERENRPPSMDELIPLTEAEALRWGSEVQAEIAKLIESRDFAGFRVRFDPNDAHPITVNRDSVTIRMKIYGEDGGYAGHTTRVFHREHDGSLYVTHSSIQLQKHAQGHGFAREWNRFLEDYYRYSGVDYIEVHAVDRGGYAWARNDYEWAPNTEHRANDVLNRLRSGVRGINEHIEQVGAWQRGEIGLDVDPLLRRYGAEHPDQLLERMLAERDAGRHILQRARDYPFGADGYPTPYEISQAGSAGRSGGDALWVGKEALLGSDWKGVKPISEGVVQHPRVAAPEATVRPHHQHPHEHDLYSRDAPRTNEDVLLNGTDVPMTREAVDHVAELMGIDLGDVRVRILTHPEDVRYLDYQGAAALTPVELGGREIHLGPAAFADADTLAATVAHEYTHVRQLRDGRELDTSTLRLLEDEAYASEGPALARFRTSFRGWEHVGDGAVSGRGSVRPTEPGWAAGDGPGPRGPDRDGGDPAGHGDGDGGAGAGRGIPRAGESSGEHGHPGDRSDGPDAGGDRSRPDHLARLIGGRPEDPPFRFERFYGDEHWGATSLAFEMRLGAHFFNDAGTLHAVREAVGRLHETLVDLATRGIPDGPLRAEVARQVEEVFFRSDVDAYTSAGQVGHGVPLKTLLEQGNLRELMTSFYNAAYFNRTNMHTLANTLIRLIDTGRVADVELPAGIDRSELAAVQSHLDRGLIRNLGRAEEFLQTRFGIESQHRFARDIAATGGVVMRSSHPYRDMLEVVNSQAGRRIRTAEEQLLLATTAGHYERLGTPLGRFERAFVESITGRLDPDTPLPWREGFVWHDTGDSRWAQGVRRDGLAVLDGISATTTRMLTAAKLIGLHGAAAERFLHGLIGWMLPARDHSLFEMLRGASIAGVEPVTVRPIRPSAVELYRNVPGVDLATIRAEIAPDGLLPHEARYQARALEPDGFTETQHKVQEIADRLWPQFESGRVTDPELAAWLDRNGIDSQDPAAVRALTDRFTKPHLMALSVYTRHSHYLINTAITARMTTLGLSDGMVGAIHGKRINSLIDHYLLKLANDEKPLPLPLALRPVLHEGAGHLDSTSTLRPAAREWVAATQDHARALAEQNRAVQAGDAAAARAAKADVRRLTQIADETRKMMLDEAARVAPRLFDEVQWHADMVYDALMQLPTVGTPEHPVIAFRGDWIQPVHSPIYGSRMMPDGVALSVLSTSRLPEVAVRFMAENPASDRRVIAVYQLTGVNARDISVFSSFAPDQEIVLPPGSRTRQVSDPDLVAWTREQLPPQWRDRVRVIVLAERE